MQKICAKLSISDEQQRMLVDLFGSHQAAPACLFKDWEDLGRTMAQIAFNEYVKSRHECWKRSQANEAKGQH